MHRLFPFTWLLLAVGSLAVAAEPQSAAVRLQWSELPPLPDPLGVAGPFVGVHNDALIVAGGANFPQPVWETNKVWHDAIHVLVKQDGKYVWKSGGKLPRSLAYGTSVSTSDGVICLGGNDANRTYANVFVLQWDPQTETIKTTDYLALPQPCAYGAAALIGDKIYLAGGQSGAALDSAQQNFWSLDLTQKADIAAFHWQELPPLPFPSRAFNLTIAVGEKDAARLYVLSGRRQNGTEVEFLKDLWEYTPATGQWRQRAALPRCVMAGTGIAVNDHQFVVLGGADGTLFAKADELKDKHPGFPKEALLYDATTNTWSSAGSIPQNQVTTQAVKWGDAIVIPSGEIRPRVRTTHSQLVSPK